MRKSKRLFIKNRFPNASQCGIVGCGREAINPAPIIRVALGQGIHRRHETYFIVPCALHYALLNMAKCNHSIVEDEVHLCIKCGSLADVDWVDELGKEKPHGYGLPTSKKSAH